MSDERLGLVVGSPTPDNNLVLRQLEGMRREFAAVLDTSAATEN